MKRQVSFGLSKNCVKQAIKGMMYEIETQPKPPTIPSTVDIPGNAMANTQVVELKRSELTNALIKLISLFVTQGRCIVDQ